MERKQRSRLVFGVLLVLAGAWLLAAQWLPAVRLWESLNFSWPFYVIGVGVLLLLVALLTGDLDMIVGACVVGGIGGILYYQNQSGDWKSWAYLWALIPGFAAVGTLLAGLAKGEVRKSFKESLDLITISGVMYVIFAFVFGGVERVGLLGSIVLILVGLSLVLRPLLKKA